MCHRKIEQTAKFERDIKKLRRHRGLDRKVQEMLNNLATDKIADGDRMPRHKGLSVFKIRCGTKNMSARKCARIIYYKDASKLIALRVHLKNDKESIPDKEITALINDYVL